jgi:isoleucyl-tRNA synthetase
LYTVVPRLLKLIEDLTNWYIRFNRKRLKGENGVEDTIFALSSLFEVLYTLARTMAPFTPFLTENMYQGLRRFLPSTDPSLSEESQQSIHFLPFPTVRQEYFDPDIERAVSRMQSIILLGRNIRESKNVPLKVCCVFITQFYLIPIVLSAVRRRR